MNTTYIVQIHVIHTMITVNNGVGTLLFEVSTHCGVLVSVSLTS